MRSDRKKRALFDHFRRSLEAAGLQAATDDSLICPLCWLDADYTSLSLEHIVPQQVGGKDTILTCTRCNNEHGSALDSHVSQFQKAKDGLDGHGTLPVRLAAFGHEVSANVEWGSGHKNFQIVGQASNPAEVSAIQREFTNRHVDDLNITFSFGYRKSRFQTALLRSAYLALFKCFGFEYAVHPVVQVIRKKICDPNLEHPDLRSLVRQITPIPLPHRHSHLIAPGKCNDVEFFLVFIQLRIRTTTTHAVFMPVPVEHSDEFYEVMVRCSKEIEESTLRVPHKITFN